MHQDIRFTRTLIDAGAKMTLSSDFDVSSEKPLVGIHNAVNRGAESVTVKVFAVFIVRQNRRTVFLSS